MPAKKFLGSKLKTCVVTRPQFAHPTAKLVLTRAVSCAGSSKRDARVWRSTCSNSCVSRWCGQWMQCSSSWTTATQPSPPLSTATVCWHGLYVAAAVANHSIAHACVHAHGLLTLHMGRIASGACAVVRPSVTRAAAPSHSYDDCTLSTFRLCRWALVPPPPPACALMHVRVQHMCRRLGGRGVCSELQATWRGSVGTKRSTTAMATRWRMQTQAMSSASQCTREGRA